MTKECGSDSGSSGVSDGGNLARFGRISIRRRIPRSRNLYLDLCLFCATIIGPARENLLQDLAGQSSLAFSFHKMFWPSSILALVHIVAEVHAISAGQQASTSWQRAVNLTSQMTNEEKANITTGAGVVERCSGNTSPVARFNIPSLCFQDGPAGVRAVDGTSAFPAQVNAASTWDVSLIYQQALAMGAEFRGKVCIAVNFDQED